jgi:diguanylate cyclase (GGDEF)-like protein/PAS domain S-box-containing protein
VVTFLIGCIIGAFVAVIGYRWTKAGRGSQSQVALPSSDEDRFSMIFNAAPFAIMLVRISDGQIVQTNAGFNELWGYTRAEVLGRTGIDLNLWVEPARLIEQLRENRHSDAHELQIRRQDGVVRDVVATVAMVHLDGAHLLITAADVTEQNRARKLEHLAHHDTLTQLPNRHMLWSVLEGVGERARRSAGVTALLFLDLDRFKAVNDTLGHRAGDELLRLVAARLQRRLRAHDLLARVGGDEFVVLLEHLDDRAQARAVAKELIEQIAHPFVLADRSEVRIGISIGITYVTDDTVDVDALIAQADEALYVAKTSGRNELHEYEPRRAESCLSGLEVSDAQGS